jgi:hypothetical protein
MVGITLLVIVLFALVQVASATSQVQRNSRERQAAWSALTEELNRVRATPYAEIVPTHDGRSFPVFLEDNANAGLRAQEGDLDGLPGEIEVTVPSPPDDAGLLLEVTVRVEWQGSFAPQTLERRIRISRPGANL